MKEATGEANMTVVTIAIIGVVLAIALTVLPGIIRRVGNGLECPAGQHPEATEDAAGNVTSQCVSD